MPTPLSRSTLAALVLVAGFASVSCGSKNDSNGGGSSVANDGGLGTTGTGGSNDGSVGTGSGTDVDGGTMVATNSDGGTSTVITTSTDGGTMTVTAPGSWTTLATTSSGCGVDATPSDPTNGDSDSVMVNGVTRTYVLYIPQNYDKTRAYPIVTLFHGIGATGAEMAAYIQMQVYSGNDAIVAFPDAVNGNWDLSGDTDLQFYDALSADLESRLCVNQQRQFALGFSLGAYMANHLGCHRPAIRAFVAADGGFNDTASTCNTASAFIYHREEDDNEAVANGEAARDKWIGIDGCTETTMPLTQFGFSGPGGDNSMANGCVQYTGCSTMPNVTWCEDTYISPEGYKHDLRDVYRVPMWNFFNSL